MIGTYLGYKEPLCMSLLHCMPLGKNLWLFHTLLEHRDSFLYSQELQENVTKIEWWSWYKGFKEILAFILRVDKIIIIIILTGRIVSICAHRQLCILISLVDVIFLQGQRIFNHWDQNWRKTLKSREQQTRLICNAEPRNQTWDPRDERWLHY